MPSVMSSDMQTLLSLCRQTHLSPYYRTKQKLVCILDYFLLELMECERLHSINPYIAKALDYIAENITMPLSLHQISEQLHLSREYTATLFKQETGKTVSAYVHEEKMKLAKQMLLAGGRTACEVARLLGYENYGYFVRIFQKHYHTTPSRFHIGSV